MRNDGWEIRNIEIPNRVVVAPMAGIPNATFRVICKESSISLMVREMISGHGIIYHNKETLETLTVDPREHPMSIQVSGGNEETLAEAAHYVDTHTAANIININMGCPVPEVTKADAGARWLLDPDKICQIVHTVVRNVNKPVTVKVRTDWGRKHIFTVENALAAQEAGASTVAIYGRIREQMYMGETDWETLREVANVLTIPFVDNGDVITPEKAKAMLEDVGADTVMVGRVALDNPWVIKDMVHYLDTGEKLHPQIVEEKVATAKEQLNGLVDLKSEKITVPKFRR